jgi:D-alanyl-lipoteichoic acid acyltransferase DltB (MBOAT superfamily)
VIFHSLEFAAFFIVTVTIYWRLPLAAQNVLLLVASYVFYGWVHPWWPVLLLITTVVDYWSARRIAELAPNPQLPTPTSRKMWLWLSIAANLGLLGVYKYFDFFVVNVAAAGASLGWNIPPIALRLVLPAGISFYTFQSMSYTIDVYRGHAPARRSFIDVAAFVSFFPHLVAGPIMRATNLLPQIEQQRTFSAAAARDATCGDRVGPVQETGHRGQHRRDCEQGVRLAASGLLRAVGRRICVRDSDLCRLLGLHRHRARRGEVVRLRSHQELPASVSCQRSCRVLASLEHFAVDVVRDYVFIPLGGSRRRPGRVATNLMITFLASGIWHGASWNYVLWGAYHGVLLIIARAAGALWASLPARKPASLQAPRWLRTLQVIVMFLLTCIGWLIFRETELRQLIADFALVPSASTPLERSAGLYLFLLALLYSAPLWAHDLWVELGGVDLTASIDAPELIPHWGRTVAQAALCGILFAVILTLRSQTALNFIYFAF